MKGITMNHWLCILNRENFEFFKSMKVWGVVDRHKNRLMKAEVGDKLVFYLIGEKIGTRTIPGGDL